MMDLATFKKTIQERPLKITEVLSVSYSLLSQRFGRYLLLSLLIYVPINLIISYISADVYLPAELTEEALETMLPGMLKVILAEVGTLFLELIAIQVTAVKVKNQLFDEENKTFGQLFYQGIRMWPRGALTLVLILIGAVVALMCTSGLMGIPILWLIAIPLLVLIGIYLVLYIDLAGCCAALRGRFGFDNLRYIAFLLKPNARMIDPATITNGFPVAPQDQYLETAQQIQILEPISGKVRRIFLVIMLLSNGLSLLVAVLSSGILGLITNEWINYAASVLIASIFSIFNVYSFICAALVFFNLEEMKRKIKVDSESNRIV